MLDSSKTSPFSLAQKRVFKIIVVGDSCVGKTCLTYRFCEGKFPQKTEATIGVDFREKTLEVDGESIKLQLWDTAGQERFRRSMVHHYYRNVHAVVFVYDVTSNASFEALSQWIEECDGHKLTVLIPRILVGNKSDCKDNQAVNTNRAQMFADMHNMPLFETSAKDDSQGDHVESIFLTLAHKLKNSRPMMPVHMSKWDEEGHSRSVDGQTVRIGGPTAASKLAENDNCSC